MKNQANADKEKATLSKPEKITIPAPVTKQQILVIDGLQYIFDFKKEELGDWRRIWGAAKEQKNNCIKTR